MKLNPTDLRIETFRNTEEGPQKNPYMKRITHIPTGLLVECWFYPISETTKAIEKLEKMVEDFNSKGAK